MWVWYFYSTMGIRTTVIRERLTVVGTGVERIETTGTGVERTTAVGTGVERITVEGVS